MTPLMEITNNIIRHTYKRNGRSPKRYCVSNQVWEVAYREMQDICRRRRRFIRMAPIDRRNFMVINVPVIGR